MVIHMGLYTVMTSLFVWYSIIYSYNLTLPASIYIVHGCINVVITCGKN